LDVFVLANSITISNVEEESSPPYSEDVVINSKKEIKNLEYTTLMATPQFSTGSNELNDPPMAPNLAQYVRKRVWRCI
jgi:Leucine-rich repeat (LRR) protein